MSEVRDGVEGLLQLDGVAEAVQHAREACTRLRWHEALRRRVPEAAAESRIRGARASAALDGAELPVALLRDRVRGIAPWPDPLDPVDRVARGAVQASVETDHVSGLVLRAPAQAVARLHVAAASGLLSAERVGRPRQGGERCQELVDLGQAPSPPEAAERLATLWALLGEAGSLPVAVVAALAHAEMCLVRPFVLGNALVARALERAVLVAGGLDPTGVAVPEAGHLAGGGPAYLGALIGYGTGRADGVALWLRHAAQAVAAGAAEGVAVCDAVLAGRLAAPPDVASDRL